MNEMKQELEGLGMGDSWENGRGNKTRSTTKN
jgi:hypothetical protein